MTLYFVFCLSLLILLYGVIDDMICLINTDAMITLDDANIENI